MVQINPDGTLLKSIYGCIPRSLPQTSLAGEYGALSCAYDNAQGATFVGDCQEVISSSRSGFAEAISAKNSHACIWKSVHRRYPDHLARVSDVIKVKAHRDESVIASAPMGSEDFLDFWGNHHADELAKRGAMLHYPPSSDIKMYKKAQQEVTDLAMHMIDTLAVLRLDRINGAKAVYSAPTMGGPVIPHHAEHSFAWQGRMWVCTCCLFRTFSPSSVSQSKRKCNGSSPLAKILQVDNGHVLWSAPLCGGGTIIYCSKCFNYASAYPRNLLLPCAKPAKIVGAKYQLKNRRHPVSRSRLLHSARLRVFVENQ